MASATKFQDFVEQLGKGAHDLSSDTFKLLLSNTAPNATDTKISQITEISAGNGYTAGGMTCDSVTYTETGGTGSFDFADEVLTASGGAIATFQYVVLYNATLAAQSPEPANLIQFWNLGSTVDIADGQSRTFQLTTVAATIA